MSFRSYRGHNKFTKINRISSLAVGFFGLSTRTVNRLVVLSKTEIDRVEILNTIDDLAFSNNTRTKLRLEDIDKGIVVV